jgi:hypothetical protein
MNDSAEKCPKPFVFGFGHFYYDLLCPDMIPPESTLPERLIKVIQHASLSYRGLLEKPQSAPKKKYPSVLRNVSRFLKKGAPA